jgi:DNA helicase II / ATP-dependent DNA helicase PcrA
LIDSFRRRLDALPYPELTRSIMTETGYEEMLRETGSPEGRDRLQNLEELLRGMQEHASTGQNLVEFLEQVALVTDLDAYDDSADRVTLMTLHSAKGLEFPVVFMVGMEDGLFPHARATDDDIEEERRLCYVGMTRAMKTLYMTHARRRRLYADFQENRPSCFLTEIPAKLTQRVGGRSEVDPSIRRRSRRSGEALSWSAAEEVRIVPDTEDGLRIGAQVQHTSFGIGVVQRIEGRGDNRKVTVAFRRAGTRKLLLKFAGLMPA